MTTLKELKARFMEDPEDSILELISYAAAE